MFLVPQLQDQRLTTSQGRPTNKLQNDIIPLIFEIWKIRDTCFVSNLIGIFDEYL